MPTLITQCSGGLCRRVPAVRIIEYMWNHTPPCPRRVSASQAIEPSAGTASSKLTALGRVGQLCTLCEHDPPHLFGRVASEALDGGPLSWRRRVPEPALLRGTAAQDTWVSGHSELEGRLDRHIERQARRGTLQLLRLKEEDRVGRLIHWNSNNLLRVCLRSSTHWSPRSRSFFRSRVSFPSSGCHTKPTSAK
jgi:hypothetical protein